MSSETLENEKLQGEEEVQAEENHTKQEDNSVENDVSEKGEEKEKDRVEEEKNEEEEEETEERGEAKSSKSTKESGYATPASERPTRERKTVDRYTVSSPDKFHKYSSFKALSIEKGNGTQLKDIPNVAFKLSKRKADDNLHALHRILFGIKGKAKTVKRNIGLFSGYVWTDNEEKHRAKTREKIDRCVKEKLVDFCNVLNIPINKATMKKEELSSKLFEFLVSPYATTDALLADNKMKGKKRGRKQTQNKSEKPTKKQKKTALVEKKQIESSDTEDSDVSEPSDAKVDSKEDDVQKSESDHDDESMSEKEEEDKEKAHDRSSKNTLNEDQATPVKKTTIVKTTESNEKPPKKSTSKTALNDNTSKSKQSASKKQKTIRENQNSKGKVANKKRTANEGKGKSSEKVKSGPSKKEMHRVVVDILKKVDFNTATLSDILKQLGTHFDVDLMNRKSEVKDIITDVINNMSDNDENEASNVGDEDDA
ncbi:hypothetical protein ACSQ67_004880 [Phaseolus vulgaris]